MNRHISKIVTYLRLIAGQFKQWFQELTRIQQAITTLVTVLVIVLLGNLFSSSQTTEEVINSPREVTLKSLDEFAGNDAALPLLGTVTSVSEATIRSESSGKLTRVYRKLGDYVTAGQVIAEFENSSERASVLQAEGAYESAKAARDIARINSGTTNTSLADVQASALNAITSAYVTMDDSVRVKTDVAFNNPRNQDAKFLLTVPDASLILSLESQRKAIEKVLLAREAKNKTLTTSSDLIAEFQLVQNEVQVVKGYLDKLSKFVALVVV
jgi:multidrug efflux pump subunit AcrA (membrane-fusion protein)